MLQQELNKKMIGLSEDQIGKVIHPKFYPSYESFASKSYTLAALAKYQSATDIKPGAQTPKAAQLINIPLFVEVVWEKLKKFKHANANEGMAAKISNLKGQGVSFHVCANTVRGRNGDSVVTTQIRRLREAAGRLGEREHSARYGAGK